MEKEDYNSYMLLKHGMTVIYNTQVCGIVYVDGGEYKLRWTQRRREELRNKWKSARLRWIYRPLRVLLGVMLVAVGFGAGVFLGWLTGDDFFIPLMIGVLTSQGLTLFWMVSEDWHEVRAGNFLRGYVGRFNRRWWG